MTEVFLTMTWVQINGTNWEDGWIVISPAEFVEASQVGREVVYLRELVRGFGYTQKGPTETWEDIASCIMTSENPNRAR